MEPPCKEEWSIVEEIYAMEKLTHRIRLQQAQLEEKWEKWTIFRLPGYQALGQTFQTAFISGCPLSINMITTHI